MGLRRHCETNLKREGFACVAGVDEVGYGAVAGPVVAGAVVLPDRVYLPGLRDSKKMTVLQRERLYVQIILRSTRCAVGMVSVQEITDLGLRPATDLAVLRAINGVGEIEAVLMDGFPVQGIDCFQQAVVRGDGKERCIAAASVLAKVARDRMMDVLHEVHPQYEFAVHKGYGTKRHLDAVEVHGLCAQHRQNYACFRHLKKE